MNSENSFSFRRLFAGIAWSGFFISLLIHSLAIFGINLTDFFPLIWLLHLGIFAVFLPMMISVLLEKGNLRDKGIKYDLITSIPRKFRYFVLFLIAYAAFNFALFANQSYEGNPEIKDGKYVLYSHGKISNRYIIREISEEEYNLRQAQILRSFSTAWLIIYLLPALHFWYFCKEGNSN